MQKVLRVRKIPFEIAVSTEPFCCERNIAQLAKAEEVRTRKIVIKSMDELEAEEIE